MSQHLALNSSVRQQDNTQHVNQGRRSDTSDSTSVWQQTRGEETHMNRPKIELCNMLISNYEYLGQVFQNLQKKLGTTGDLSQFGDWSFQDQCIDVGIVHVINDKSSHPSWTQLHKEFGDVQERQIWGHSEFIRYHSEVDMGSSRRDSECEAYRKHRSIMDEIYIVSWSSDQVGESKSTCLLRFCFVLGKISRSFRSKSNMGRPSGLNSIEYFLRRITGHRWRTNWIRVEYFPRIYLMADCPEDPERSTRTTYWARTVRRSDHLHARVQRHRLDDESKWRKLYFEFRKSQSTCGEILARTLDIPWSWKWRKWFTGYSYKLEGKWDPIVSQMVQWVKDTDC